MHSYTPNQRRRRAGRAIGATTLLAISCLVIPGGSSLHAEERDSLVPTSPAVTPSKGNAQNRGQTPDYWAGSYWDSREGNGFWHNLKPKSSTKPTARERKRPAFGFGASVKDPDAGSADKRR